jgi:cytochrome c
MKTLKALEVVAASAVLSLSLGTAAIAADGAELYKTKTCWSCHGKDAKTPLLPIMGLVNEEEMRAIADWLATL